jgi:hypothetical protein
MTAHRLVLPLSMALVFFGVWYSMTEPQTASGSGSARGSIFRPEESQRSSGEPISARGALDRMIADTSSSDVSLRYAALNGLASAPRAQAVPVLSNVLMNGERGDRPQALRSLQQLASSQGDDDGAIRSALRNALYIGDNEALAPALQQALNEVDATYAQRAANTQP